MRQHRSEAVGDLPVDPNRARRLRCATYDEQVVEPSHRLGLIKELAVVAVG